MPFDPRFRSFPGPLDPRFNPYYSTADGYVPTPPVPEFFNLTLGRSNFGNALSLWEKQMADLIHYGGRVIDISYAVQKQCEYCVVNPITRDGRPNCTTCHGTGEWTVSTVVSVRGVVNKFSGNMAATQYNLEKFGYLPEGKARVTFWLPDILKNPYNEKSHTVLDSSVGILIDGQRYTIRDGTKVGWQNLRVGIYTMERVR